MAGGDHESAQDGTEIDEGAGIPDQGSVMDPVQDGG